MNPNEQQFLNDLDKKLWNAADRLRSSLDAAVYKHIVLGLIFLKYASDAFDDRRQELARKFRDPDDEYFMDPAIYGLTVEADRCGTSGPPPRALRARRCIRRPQ